ncbi:MAG: PAS domain-containing protein, partial [Bacteroidota bacterium]|nr:PAS domain-containing protein [Bacteroidota bacterium]
MMTNSQLLIQSIGDAVLFLDQDGYIQSINPATTTLTGYTEAELTDQPLHKLYANEDDSIRAEYEKGMALKEGKFITEGWKLRKDGTRFWSEITMYPVKEKNELKGFGCVLRDVSNRKTVELEIRQREERFRLMVEGVKDYAIFML